MDEYQKLDEDILGLTGSKEWKESFMQIMEAEAAASLQNQIEAKDWDSVQYQRGYRKALEFVANVREVTQTLIRQREYDADV